MSRITHVHAREVLDSRGRPTVEVEVRAGEALGRAMVPSGASTGAAEALELRDGDAERYGGRGVRRAVANVNERLAPVVLGCDPAEQFEIDRRLVELDGTDQFSRLGANAILGVSLAAAHAAAAVESIPLYEHLNRLWRECCGAGVPPARATETAALQTPIEPALPLPMTNLISGGLHAGGNLDFQDFLIVPVGAPSYSTALEWLVRVSDRLSEILLAGGYEGRLLADEGGFGPKLAGPAEALEFVVRAIEAAGLAPARDVAIALDVAATHFYDGSAYYLGQPRRKRSAAEMIDLLEELVDRFGIVSIEDGLAEEDWDGWRELTRRLGGRTMLVGDDLLATRAERLERAIGLGAANAVLVKPNQVGTLSQTLRFMRLARESGLTRIVSARSGETEDATIADLAVGSAAAMIKIGSIHHGERLAKYNQLLRIEEQGVPYRGERFT